MNDKPRVGRPPNQERNIGRNIRLTDAEWEGFCQLLGPIWLREQIAIAIASQHTKTTKE